jgi:hypothetical protein
MSRHKTKTTERLGAKMMQLFLASWIHWNRSWHINATTSLISLSNSLNNWDESVSILRGDAPAQLSRISLLPGHVTILQANIHQTDKVALNSIVRSDYLCS